MRSLLLITLFLVALAPAASADLNTYYTGVERVKGKETPAKVQFSLSKDYVGLKLVGSSAWRLLFLAKEKILRMVDDAEKQYFDISENGLQASMVAEVQSQLDQLPPEQRAMAEQALTESLNQQNQAPPSEYVWTKNTQDVLGYPCTQVNVMQGDKKRSEYWGTASADLKVTKEETKTMQDMHRYLGNSDIMVPGSEGARSFAWDPETEGYPLITRCFEGDSITLDLKAESFDRKPIPKELFEIPADYKRPDGSK